MMKYAVLVLCVGLSLLMVASGKENKVLCGGLSLLMVASGEERKASAVNPKSVNLLVRTVRHALMSKRDCGAYKDPCTDDADCCDDYECDYGNGDGECMTDW